MKKRLIAGALCCLCLISSVQVALAAETVPNSIASIQPRWVNITKITLTMVYSNNKVNWDSTITANSDTKSIKATYTLEKQNTNGTYSPVDSWSDSSETRWLDIANSATTPKGTYRLTVTVTVTSTSGVVETATDNLVKTFS